MIRATNIIVTLKDNDSAVLLNAPVDFYFRNFEELYDKENQLNNLYQSQFNVGKLTVKFSYYLI